ncbi:Dihydroorotase [Elusimicrobium minutum Pei191]|uniref:Dihydroorotase n=1 Tax=Elusimicrobium minutum (strain Pei191) TaxID=445932 RepID=PYRC_ELUMP|nr:dihydroorotase [Elusimicrobium minutum]B2KCN5.1 RecName: Full=Dihydroorotase; Short=DHOase [Elusimicrobium minutum Pei191]ACC98281.1 Dihydroorotase [Elusimicrobium minutum Pei191]
MKYLIKNAHVIDPANKIDGLKDILIENGKIAAVENKIEDNAAKIIDAKGLTAMPGFVDMHTHLREPGQEGKETIFTGTKAALKGGFTTVCMMPNTNPAMDSKNNLAIAQDIIRKTANVNVEIMGAITKNRAGKELSNFAELKQAGAIALSDDGSGVEDDAVMQAAFKESVKQDILLISHSEDSKLSAGGVMNEGLISTKLGLKPISNASEYEMVKREIQLAKGLDAKIHIAHVSTKESCEIIAKAKKQGVMVTAEATPHHFTLTDKACESFSGNTKMNPPLRSEADVEALKQALKDGTIDAIATDHAPHAVHEKEVEFDLAYFGIIGLETAFPLAYDVLVKSGLIDMAKLVGLMSLNPSKILGLKKGTLTPGADADITIVDLNKQWVYSKEEVQSLSCNSPFIGKNLQGYIEYTFVGGELKLENGTLKVKDA